MGQQEPGPVHRMGFFPYFFFLTHKTFPMKKILLALVFSLVLMACFFSFAFDKLFSDKDISIHVKETDNTYQLYANYNRSQSRRIQKYMDEELSTNRFFRNAKMNALVTLDDRTSFYVKIKPGALYIKLNKNDFESYSRIKKLGEGLKLKLTEN